MFNLFYGTKSEELGSHHYIVNMVHFFQTTGLLRYSNFALIMNDTTVWAHDKNEAFERAKEKWIVENAELREKGTQISLGGGRSELVWKLHKSNMLRDGNNAVRLGKVA